MYDMTNAVPTYFEFSGARTNDIEIGKKMDIQKAHTYLIRVTWILIGGMI